MDRAALAAGSLVRRKDVVEEGKDSPILERITNRQARVGIIGLGYVGLPLAIELARAGLQVTGIDTDAQRVKALNAGRSFIPDVSDATLASAVGPGLLAATSDYAVLREMDAVIICVPTPLGKSKDPDISYVVSAVDGIMQHAHTDMLVVLESTTYPGTTEELLLPRILSAGYKVGENFFLAFSPERTDPANRRFGVRNTPKVIGGVTPRCARVAETLYRCAIDEIVPVSSPGTAEMVKLLENTFRAVNIGLVNEMALICDKLGLDIWEVIEAASTKPYGFMPFYPGPGLGGHCLPIDPLYLSWKLKTLHYNARFIELADDVNTGMPRHVVERVTEALNAHRKAVNGSRILVLGVAYKRDVNDVRESPAFEIIETLMSKGGRVSYHDPYVPHLAHDSFALDSISLDEAALSAFDCVVVVTDHSTYDWEWIATHVRLVVDTRNALRDVPAAQAEVVKL
jgi:UDP-N-acetyl-D-glucosamine dehydrogenase